MKSFSERIMEATVILSADACQRLCPALPGVTRGDMGALFDSLDAAVGRPISHGGVTIELPWVSAARIARSVFTLQLEETAGGLVKVAPGAYPIVLRGYRGPALMAPRKRS